MIDFLIKFFTFTIGRIHLKSAIKQFNINDLDLIREKLKGKKFAPITVTTYGLFGSNFLIRVAQWFGVHKWNTKTHVLIWIDNDRVIEANGTLGIRRISLAEAIGQRDEVQVFLPWPYLGECENAQKFLLELLKTDAEKNIEYDNEHNLTDPREYDCAEVFFQSLNYELSCLGFKQISPVRRLGRGTYTPSDLESNRYLMTIYNSLSGGFI